MDREPVMKSGVAAAVTTLVTAVLALLVALGVGLTPETQVAVLSTVAAVIGVVGAAAPLVASWRARAKVTPVSSPRP